MLDIGSPILAEQLVTKKQVIILRALEHEMTKMIILLEHYTKYRCFIVNSLYKTVSYIQILH